MYYSFIQKYQYIIKMNDFALRNKGANIAQATKQIFFARLSSSLCAGTAQDKGVFGDMF